ncbi:MAG: hypothetical protein FWH22_03030 [Fibromonadales bacterium]|nr:hypothetical protein [Fibromonadales bacterium]
MFHVPINATADCGTAKNLVANCSHLKVKPCEGFTNLATFCPGATWEDVEWIELLPGDSRSLQGSGCFYTASLDYLNANWGNEYRVNGVSFNGYANSSTSNFSKVDGGYYIYGPSGIPWFASEGDHIKATGTGIGKPACAE